ncbi:class I SAM-dependent methyltransferase [Anaerosacchariphilus polymeriproducens]|uniref:Methyltransferase domain-containing protein n=1 Tax=Anaerosacchariphilus polymeriproducens TaxID=1812858 RepID=A0A371ATC1_9FIRM|nr:class I SAM-dependent methyltransferase [Anaerosacchariphilus polymeriproducens]RDU22808.1 methyltransferase domain-containing protein [Anaerosacchariphilus polymeriproducens]
MDLENKYIVFPNDKIKKGEKIAIYGAGKIGRCLVEQLQATNYCRVEVLIDKEADGIDQVHGISCILPQEIKNYNPDKILIGKFAHQSEIYETLIALGIEESKIIRLEEKYILPAITNVVETIKDVNWLTYYNEAEKAADKQVDYYILPFIKKYSMTDKDKSIVCDFACGHGRIANRIRDFAKEFVGCDISEKAVDYCNTRFQKESNISFITCNSNEIPLEDNQFDFIYSWDAMVHFPIEDMQLYINEFYRLLKVQGYVLIHHSNWKNCKENKQRENALSSNRHWRSNVSKEEIARLSKQAGFEVTEQKVIDWGAISELDCITVLKKTDNEGMMLCRE